MLRGTPSGSGKKACQVPAPLTPTKHFLQRSCQARAQLQLLFSERAKCELNFTSSTIFIKRARRVLNFNLSSASALSARATSTANAPGARSTSNKALSSACTLSTCSTLTYLQRAHQVRAQLQLQHNSCVYRYSTCNMSCQARTAHAHDQGLHLTPHSKRGESRWCRAKAESSNSLLGEKSGNF